MTTKLDQRYCALVEVTNSSKIRYYKIDNYTEEYAGC